MKAINTKTNASCLGLFNDFRSLGSEKLLHYIWQFQYFNQSELKTIKGERLEILFPGTPNCNQGPDFLNARIKIDGTMLVGTIELHLKTSGWKAHGHQTDPNYKNVILHVVVENDCNTGLPFLPVLELQSRVSTILLQRYASLMEAGSFIPCAGTIAEVKDIIWMAWKERLLAERLTRKANLVFQYLAQNKQHWEESCWWLLARNFGTKVNSEAFEALAQSIPVTILGRHKSQIHQLEALLFGQAGLLTGTFKEDYPQLLQREYDFLKKKYGLQPIRIPVHFLRMRPGNFPTVRLAQLAMLIHQSGKTFSKMLEAENVQEVKELFEVTANDYWHYHYKMDEPSGFKKKTVGMDMIDNLVINSMVPLLFAYGLYHNEEKYKSRALRWLEAISGEVNAITKGFSQLQLDNKTAYDSQAFIELKTQYCNHKHCLKCAVGNALLSR